METQWILGAVILLLLLSFFYKALTARKRKDAWFDRTFKYRLTTMSYTTVTFIKDSLTRSKGDKKCINRMIKLCDEELQRRLKTKLS